MRNFDIHDHGWSSFPGESWNHISALPQFCNHLLSVVMVRQDAAVVAQIISISAVYQGHNLFKRR